MGGACIHSPTHRLAVPVCICIVYLAEGRVSLGGHVAPVWVATWPCLTLSQWRCSSVYRFVLSAFLSVLSLWILWCVFIEALPLGPEYWLRLLKYRGTGVRYHADAISKRCAAHPTTYSGLPHTQQHTAVCRTPNNIQPCTPCVSISGISDKNISLIRFQKTRFWF